MATPISCLASHTWFERDDKLTKSYIALLAFKLSCAGAALRLFLKLSSRASGRGLTIEGGFGLRLLVLAIAMLFKPRLGPSAPARASIRSAMACRREGISPSSANRRSLAARRALGR